MGTITRYGTKIAVLNTAIVDATAKSNGALLTLEDGGDTLISQSVHFNESTEIEDGSVLIDMTDTNTIRDSFEEIREAVYRQYPDTDEQGNQYGLRVVNVSNGVELHLYSGSWASGTGTNGATWNNSVIWDSGTTATNQLSQQITLTTSEVPNTDLPNSFDVRYFKGSDFDNSISDEFIVCKLFHGFREYGGNEIRIYLDTDSTGDSLSLIADPIGVFLDACKIPRDVAGQVAEMVFQNQTAGHSVSTIDSPVKVDEFITMDTLEGDVGSVTTLVLSNSAFNTSTYGERNGYIYAALNGSLVATVSLTKPDYLITTGLHKNKDYSFTATDSFGTVLIENVKAGSNLDSTQEDLNKFECSKSNSFRFALKLDDLSHLNEYPIEEQLLSCESLKEVVYEGHSTLKSSDYLAVQIKSSKPVTIVAENLETKEIIDLIVTRPFGKVELVTETVSYLDRLYFEEIKATSYRNEDGSFKKRYYTPVYIGGVDSFDAEDLLNETLRVDIDGVIFKPTDVVGSKLILQDEKDFLEEKYNNPSNSTSKAITTVRVEDYSVYEAEIDIAGLGFSDKDSFRIHVSNGEDVFVSEEVRVEDSYKDSRQRVLVQYWAEENTVVNFSTGIKFLKRTEIDHVTAKTKIDKDSVTAEAAVYLADLDNYEVSEMIFYPTTEEEARGLVIALSHPLLYIGGVGYVVESAPTMEDIGRTNIYPVKASFIKTNRFLSSKDLPNKSNFYRAGNLVNNTYDGVTYDRFESNAPYYISQSNGVYFNEGGTSILQATEYDRGLTGTPQRRISEFVEGNVEVLELGDLDVTVTALKKTGNSSWDKTNFKEGERLVSISSVIPLSTSNHLIIGRVTGFTTPSYKPALCIVKYSKANDGTVTMDAYVIGDTQYITGTKQMWDISDEFPIAKIAGAVNEMLDPTGILVGGFITLFDRVANEFVTIRYSDPTTDDPDLLYGDFLEPYQKVSVSSTDYRTSLSSLSIPADPNTVKSVFFAKSVNTPQAADTVFIGMSDGNSDNTQQIVRYDMPTGNVSGIDDSTATPFNGRIYSNASLDYCNGIISSINGVMTFERLNESLDVIDGITEIKDMFV